MYTCLLSSLPRHQFRAIDFLRCISTAAGRQRAIGHGQNLSTRYTRLEKSVRQKQTIQRDLEELSSSSTIVPEKAGKKQEQNMFKGLVVPELPRAPESDECCMSGCTVCVYDLYEESMAAYKGNVAALRNALVSMGVPEYEWPASIMSFTQNAEIKSNVVLSAFAEMERALREKQKSSASSRPSNMTARPIPHSARSTMTSDVVEGIRWILFSNR